MRSAWQAVKTAKCAGSSPSGSRRQAGHAQGAQDLCLFTESKVPGKAMKKNLLTDSFFFFLNQLLFLRPKE